MSYPLTQNTATWPLLFAMVDSADHLSPKTGLSPTVTISKNGGAFGVPAGAVSEVGNGWYKVAPNASDVSTLGPLVLHATSAGADATDEAFDVLSDVTNVQMGGGYALSQSQTTEPLLFALVDTADHFTPLAGASPTVVLSKNGAAFASPAGAVSEVGSGVYKVAPNATDTNTVGPLILHVTATGADPSDAAYFITGAAASGQVFLSLYGNELDRELGSADRSQLFTIPRRKAAMNAAQLEWLERTECLAKEVAISLSDGVQEYDLENAISDFGWISKQGVSIKIVSGSTTRYLEGDDLVVTSVDRLNQEEPGWRMEAAGTPRKVYPRRNGGALMLGFHPAPDITGVEVWTALLPYVILPADLVADSDVPFTVSGNAILSLKPYWRGLVHFAAYDLEKFRKDTERGAVQLQLYESYVQRYIGHEKPKGGQQVRFARTYRGSIARTVWPRRYNPRAYP